MVRMHIANKFIVFIMYTVYAYGDSFTLVTSYDALASDWLAGPHVLQKAGFRVILQTYLFHQQIPSGISHLLYLILPSHQQL